MWMVQKQCKFVWVLSEWCKNNVDSYDFCQNDAENNVNSCDFFQNGQKQFKFMWFLSEWCKHIFWLIWFSVRMMQFF